MTYTVTFYAFDREVGLTTHQVPALAIAAYLDAPGIALAAAQTVPGNPKPCGYRVVDSYGVTVLDYRNKKDRR